MKTKRTGTVLSVASALALATYLGLAGLHGGAIGSVGIGGRELLLLLVVVSGAVAAFTWWAVRSGGDAVPNLGLVSGFALAAFLVADALGGVYLNSLGSSGGRLDAEDERTGDANLWHGELAPRRYFPTSGHIQLYKPNVLLTAEVFGEFYRPSMLRSPLLVDSVLERRSVTYSINRHGFRESSSFEESRIYALGDSFVFGYATDEGVIWTDVLERLLSQPIYNLGVSATGPGVQVPLLERTLAEHADSLRIDRLLWLVFEGNDLENTYSSGPRPRSDARSRRVRLDGTWLGAVVDFPRSVRDRSLLYRFRSGEVTLGGRRGPIDLDRFASEGVDLAHPLYRSATLGYRLFSVDDVERATLPDSYVDGHRNWPALTRAFDTMAGLARGHGFAVSVVLVPSAARLHGPSFDGFPVLSERPHLLDRVRHLAEERSFEVIDLLAGMRPLAQQELLFYRDDHHWNRRGNQVAAELIRDALFASGGVP